MNDYLYTCGIVYDDLNKALDSFTLEAKIISGAKCHLLNNGGLDGLTIDGHSAYVEDLGGDYLISYDGLTLEIEVFDKQIIAYHYR